MDTIDGAGAAYVRLAEHLDRLPGGFAPAANGSHVALLKQLFTVEEAGLAVHLTLEREEASVIGARAGLAPTAAAAMLDEMARKGLIFAVYADGAPMLYQAAPWVVGIYEFQVNNLNSRLLRRLAVYYGSRGSRAEAETVPQMRTIPIDQSIDPRLRTMPYEQAHALVEGHSRFAVAPCICRAAAGASGKACDAPIEACLVFDEWAEYYIRTGRGRAIEQDDAKRILAEADAANLVLQPSNSRNAAFLCCCCGCCCGVLGSIKRNPRPADVMCSPFVATFDADACHGCLVCLERCQMGALTEADGQVAFNADRCIGCGLCVTTCANRALSLIRRDEAPDVPLRTMEEVWRIGAGTQPGRTPPTDLVAEPMERG